MFPRVALLVHKTQESSRTCDPAGLVQTPNLVRSGGWECWQGVVPPFRGAPSTVRNFMTSSGCSMEGALPKKEAVPTVLGVAQI